MKSIKEDHNAFSSHLIAGDEQAALNALTSFIDDYGKEAFLNYNENYSYTVTTKETHISFEVGLLIYCILRKWNALTLKLLSLDVSCNTGTICHAHPFYDNQSPLMIACELANIEIIKALVEKGADLLHQSSTGLTALMRINSVDIYDILINEAEEQEIRHELLSMRDNQSLSAFDYADIKNETSLKSFMVKNSYEFLLKSLSISEENALKELAHYISVYSKENLFFDSDWPEPLLCVAVRKNYSLLVSELIKQGALLEKTFSLSNRIDENWSGASPLMIASLLGYEEIVKILLSHGSNILHRNTSSKSVLMMTNTKPVWDLLIDKAIKEKYFVPLMLMTCKKGNSTLYYQCKLGNADIVNDILNKSTFSLIENFRVSLDEARLTAWLMPEKSKAFNEICLRLRPSVPKVLPPGLNQMKNGENAFFKLFGSATPVIKSEIDWKEAAKKKMIAECYALLMNPTKCIKYLTFLNTELARYYKEKFHRDFPTLSVDSYQFKIIDGTYYPVPNQDYIGIKKESALPKLLQLIFQKYGLAQHAYKWMGFVPHEIADQQVEQGDFITESRLYFGLNHGKLSHMLQQLILIYAFEHGEIDLSSCCDDESKKQITVKEILEAFISIRNHEGKSVWSLTRDTRSLFEVKFSDPHRLNSIIMSEGKSLGFPQLADYCIDSYCKGFFAWRKALGETTAATSTDNAEFLAQLNDLRSEIFPNIPSLFHYTMKQEEKKTSSAHIKMSFNYAVITKDYKLSEEIFQTRKFVC